MKKVLYISEQLVHYRVPLFDLLADYYDLTIAHSSNSYSNTKFKQVKISLVSLFGFVWVRNLPDIINYDVVILSFNIRLLNFNKIIFGSRKYKLLLHGIGVSASLVNRYDFNKKYDFIRRIWIKFSDGVLFYDIYPAIKYAAQGINSNKLFVAYNTVASDFNFQYKSKKYESFIFLGSLYKQKKLFILLEAYKIINNINNNVPALEIIGNGEEYNNVKNWVHDNKLKNKITLHGEVLKNEQLLPIMQKAIACISPDQAGLTVLKCFSYGVPIITTKNAITGGELFSIIDNVNGLYFNGSVNDLKEKLLILIENPRFTRTLSNNCHEYFNKFRNPSIWVNAFINAIET